MEKMCPNHKPFKCLEFKKNTPCILQEILYCAKCTNSKPVGEPFRECNMRNCRLISQSEDKKTYICNVCKTKIEK